MKKQIGLVMGLAMLSTGAIASKARMEALGQDANGSLYLDDARNIFLNPAQLNYHKDFVTLEFGNTAQPATTEGADLDTTGSPKAEGGIFKSQGNLVYGVYFGAESNVANGLRTLSMGAGVVTEQNNVDLFIGGDAGIQWGARLTYGSFVDDRPDSSDDREESSATRLAVGAITGDLEAYLNIGISNEAEGAGDAEFDGKTSYEIGAVYRKNDYDFMVQVRSLNAEDGDNDEYKTTRIGLGVAKSYKLNNNANVWTSVFYRNENTDSEFDATGPETGEVKDVYVPVVIGVEVKAKDWLTLRGSVSHEIFGTNTNDDGEKSTRQNTTTVAAGASLTWGDLSLDGMIGNDTSCSRVDQDSDGTAEFSECATNTNINNGILNTDNLLSRVSLTYKF